MRGLLPRIAYLSLVICLLQAGGLLAAKEGGLPNLKSGLVEKAPGGQVDWGKEMFYAVGEGAVPSVSECPNRAIAVLKAKDYAKMDAIANMRMLIAGTSISYSATGKDYMVNDATLTQKIEGYVKNVVVLSTEEIKQGKDMTIKVTVACPMYGYDGPGAAILQRASELAREVGVEVEESEIDKSAAVSELPIAVTKNMDLQPVKIEIQGKTTVVQPEPVVLKAVLEEKPEEKSVSHIETAVQPLVDEPASETKTTKSVIAETKIEPATAEAVAPSVEKVKAVAIYTSVVVDTLGLNVMRAMSPKIRTQGGSEVYGTIQIDPDEVQDHGPVAYVRTLDDARTSSRAGSNPLVIKAVGRAGGRRMCDVVLSDDDVEKLNAANTTAKPPFLAEMKVVFVVDPLKL